MFFVLDKEEYDNYDVNFTYALLIGSIVYDIISLVKLIFSEWSIIRRPWLSHPIPEFILKGNDGPDLYSSKICLVIV